MTQITQTFFDRFQSARSASSAEEMSSTFSMGRFHFFVFTLCLLLVTLFGCSHTQERGETAFSLNPSDTETLPEYFPVAVGSKWHYRYLSGKGLTERQEILWEVLSAKKNQSGALAILMRKAFVIKGTTGGDSAQETMMRFIVDKSGVYDITRGKDKVIPYPAKVGTAFLPFSGDPFKRASVVGFEDVRTAAGLFPSSLKILWEETRPSTGLGMESTPYSYLWFSPTVGFVKMESARGEFVQELLSYTIPGVGAGPKPEEKPEATQTPTSSEPPEPAPPFAPIEVNPLP